MSWFQRKVSRSRDGAWQIQRDSPSVLRARSGDPPSSVLGLGCSSASLTTPAGPQWIVPWCYRQCWQSDHDYDDDHDGDEDDDDDNGLSWWWWRWHNGAWKEIWIISSGNKVLQKYGRRYLFPPSPHHHQHHKNYGNNCLICSLFSFKFIKQCNNSLIQVQLINTIGECPMPCSDSWLGFSQARQGRLA